MNKDAYRIQRIQRALVHFIGGRAVQAGARAVLVLVLVRIMSVADYGAYMLIVGTAEMMVQIASFGILPVSQRYLPQLLNSLPIRKLYRFVTFLVVAQMIVLGGSAYLVGKFWAVLAVLFGLSTEQVVATNLVAWLFVVIPAFRFSADMLEVLLEQGRSQLVRAIMVLGRVVILALFMVTTSVVGLRKVLLIDMAVTSVTLLMAWALIQRSLRALHSGVESGEMPVREMARFAWHMTLVGPMSASGSPGAIRLVIGNALGVAETGLFSFLQSLERLISRYLPGTLLQGIIRPVLITRTVGRDSTTILEAGTGMLLKMNLLIVVGGLVFIAICGSRLVEVLSGGKFSGAGLTLFMMYAAMAVSSQRSVIEMVMQITGHTRALAITGAVAPFALFAIWLFGRHGLNVAVIILVVAGWVSNGLASWVLTNDTEWFQVDWRGVMAIVWPAIVVVVPGIVLASWWSPIPVGLAALMFFVVLARFARPFRKSEIAIVERMMGKRDIPFLSAFISGFAV